MLISLKLIDQIITLPRSQEGGFDIPLLSLLLTKQGFEVDKVILYPESLEKIVIGQIKKIEPHPQAQKLNVCEVDVGQSLQIVCGAKQIRVGMFVPVALVGAKLPGGIEIKDVELRGIPSSGMMCAREELKLPITKDFDEDCENGLWDLGSTFDDILLQNHLGSDLVKTLDIDDVVFELNVTPNRPDALSHIGVAREIATGLAVLKSFPDVQMKFISSLNEPLYRGKSQNAKNLAQSLLDNSQFSLNGSSFVVTNHFGLSAFFLGFQNISVQKSPHAIRHRLQALSVQTVNNVVDFSNFILVLYGQPSHAYDFDKLAQTENKTELFLTKNQSKEFHGLDGKNIKITEDDAVVTDGKTIQALLGIMGAENSKVSKETKNIVVEFADPHHIPVRRSSRRHGKHTDSGFIFEKGLNPVLRVSAARFFIDAFEKNYVGASHSVYQSSFPLEGIFTCYDRKLLKSNYGPFSNESIALNGRFLKDEDLPQSKEEKWKLFFESKKRMLSYHHQTQKKILGELFVDFEQSQKTLEHLGFKPVVSSYETLALEIPHWREGDIDGAADMVEEVIRVAGIDLVQNTPIIAPLTYKSDDRSIEIPEQVARSFANLGYTEVIGLHFMKESDLLKLQLPSDALGRPVHLMNPVIGDEPLMQTTLIPDLLRKTVKNLSFNVERGLIFHVSRTFSYNEKKEAYEYSSHCSYDYVLQEKENQSPHLAQEFKVPRLINETPRVAGIVFGSRLEKNWLEQKTESFDIFDLKSHIGLVLKPFGLDLSFELLPTSHPFFKALYPKRSLLVLLDKKPVGWLGELHPKVKKEFGIEVPCLGFELNLTELFKQHSSVFVPIRDDVQKFQNTYRDFSFILSEKKTYQEIEIRISNFIMTEQKKHRFGELKAIRLLDVYRGSNIEVGKKSFTLRLEFEPLQADLGWLESLSLSLLKILETEFQATLRIM